MKDEKEVLENYIQFAKRDRQDNTLVGQNILPLEEYMDHYSELSNKDEVNFKGALTEEVLRENMNHDVSSSSIIQVHGNTRGGGGMLWKFRRRLKMLKYTTIYGIQIWDFQ